MSKSGKTAARRASALLMSALLVFSTCPVEALGQDENATDAQPGQELIESSSELIDEPEMPNQEPLPEETAANETEELNTTDPQAIPETEEPVEEELTEEENVQVTEEEQVEEVTTDEKGAESDEQGLSVMSEDSYFERDGVEIENISKGTVSYNATTKTLTLNNVTCEDINSSHNLTIVLVGTNTVSNERFIEVNGALTILGTGSLQSNGSYVCWKCKQFVLKSGTIKSDIEVFGPTTTKISGGTIVGTIKHYWGSRKNHTVAMSGGSVSGSISCDTLTMTGGSVSGSISCGTLTMSGGSVSGSISCGTFTMKGGTITGNVNCSGPATMTGGSIHYKGSGDNDRTTVVSCGKLLMKGGSIRVSRCETGIDCKEMIMTGGSITLADCDYALHAYEGANAKTASITIKKGNVTITNPSHIGIWVYYGNFTMTGGNVAVKNSYGDALDIRSTTYRGKHYGGKVKITGGKLVASIRQPSDSSYEAISADSITNKPGCLKKIVGRLSTGARFKSGGNTYQVSEDSGVNVYRYGSKKTEAKFKQVTYGKYKYEVTGVAANAFNTKRGAALTSITFQNNYGIRTIGANAFKGTKSLRRLIFKSWFSGVNMNWNGSKYKLKVDKKYFKCNKKAFSGAGANGGSGLTVTLQGGTDQAHLYRNLLLSRGLPSSAKVTTTYFNN